MAETNEPSLHELNQHFFASLLPETHGKPAEKPKKGKAPQYSAEQLALLTFAGITDPATADPAAVAAALGKT